MYIHAHIYIYRTLIWKTDMRIIRARVMYIYEHMCVYVYTYTCMWIEDTYMKDGQVYPIRAVIWIYIYTCVRV